MPLDGAVDVRVAEHLAPHRHPALVRRRRSGRVLPVEVSTRRRERVGLLDVGQVRGVERAPTSGRRGCRRRCLAQAGGVDGSSAPAITSVGARDAGSSAVAVEPPDRLAAAGVALGRRRPQHGLVGGDDVRPARRKPGVNQRPTTASATTPTPSARTTRARSCHGAGSPKRADVQARTSRSTRSGALAASCRQTAPPRDSPHSDARCDADLVEQGLDVARQELDGGALRRERRLAVPAVVDAEHPEAGAEGGELRLPRSSVVPSEGASTRSGASSGPSRR